MVFRDEFMPEGSDDDPFGSSEEDAEDDDLLMQPGAQEAAAGDSDEVEFVPPGGVAPEFARASAASSAASFAGAAPAHPKKKQRSVEPVAEMSQRKLARLTSNPKPESPVAQNLLCIVGYPLEHPVPVHPVKLDNNGKQ